MLLRVRRGKGSLRCKRLGKGIKKVVCSPLCAEMKDFFMSCNSADRSLGRADRWAIRGGGYSVPLEAWNSHPGSDSVVEMDCAAKETERSIAVLSPDYLSAPASPR